MVELFRRKWRELPSGYAVAHALFVHLVDEEQETIRDVINALADSLSLPPKQWLDEEFLMVEVLAE
jgi:hypothetical protein